MIGQVGMNPLAAKAELPRRELRFNAYTWSKIHLLRSISSTAFGCFGVSRIDAPLSIVDLVVVRQVCTPSTVAICENDPAGTDLALERRIWIQSFPFSDAMPDPATERTFAVAVDGSDWSVLCVFGEHGHRYAKLQVDAGPGAQELLEPVVCHELPFQAFDAEAWKKEFERNVDSVDPFEANVSGAYERWGHDVPIERPALLADRFTNHAT